MSSNCRQPATVTLTIQFSADCAQDALTKLADWLAEHGIETDDDLDEDNWAIPGEDDENDEEIWNPSWDDDLPDELDDHMMRSFRPHRRGRGKPRR